MPDSVAYKILARGELDVLERDGAWNGSTDDMRDGYIHLSTAEQLTETLARHFAGREDLALVSVDLDAAGEAVRWEASRGGALFPHLYATLTLDLALAYGPLELDGEGGIMLPVAG